MKTKRKARTNLKRSSVESCLWQELDLEMEDLEIDGLENIREVLKEY